jgi:tetratricopeptide (TPR) repeat protein
MIRRIFTITIILVIKSSLLMNTYCQEKTSFKKLFNDGIYFMNLNYHEDALINFRQAINIKENQNLHYLIGFCYLNIQGQKHVAINHLREAVSSVTFNYSDGSFKEEQAPIEAYFYLGMAYHINNELEKALDNYNIYKSLLPEKNVPAIEFTEQQIEACNNAVELKNDSIGYKIIKLNNEINNDITDYNVIASFNDSVLVYIKKMKFYNAIFFSDKKTEDGWIPGTNISDEIQSDGDLFPTSLTNDGKTLFLQKLGPFISNIYISKYDGNKWQKAKPFELINTKYTETHACMTNNGNTIYFTSNCEGYGGLDIFRIDKEGESWGAPKNLGETINTTFNEEAPFLSDDGCVLFFSSQGHKSMGGYDIFYSTKNKNKEWMKPVNIGYPVNSTDDDLFCIPVKECEAAYFTRLSKNRRTTELFKVQLPDDLVKRLYMKNQ